MPQPHKSMSWSEAPNAEDATAAMDNNNGALSPDGDADWQMLSEENGVRLYQYDRDRSDGASESPKNRFQHFSFGERPNGSPEGKHRGGVPIMKASSIVEAATEDIFTEIMDLGPSRRRWDPTFRAGSVVEMTDGHTDVIHEVLQRLWQKKPRDFCLLRYWRRRDNGSYEVYLCSTNHPACPPNGQCVRAKLISGGFVISPMKPAPGTRLPCSLVEHMIEMDSQGWSGLLRKISNHHNKLRCLMLKRVAGLQDLFRTRREEMPGGIVSCPEDGGRVPCRRRPLRLPVPDPACGTSATTFLSLDGSEDFRSHALSWDDDDDDDDDFFDCEEDVCCAVELPGREGTDPLARKPAFKIPKPTVKFPFSSKPSLIGTGCKSENSTPRGSKDSIVLTEHTHGAVAPELNLTTISGTFARVDLETGRNGWNQPPGQLFKVRAEGYLRNKEKAAGQDPVLTAVAVDWYKSHSRMDNVVSHPRNSVRLALEAASTGLSYQPLLFVVNLQIPGQTHYSAVAYFVYTKPVEEGSMLHRFLHGDDHFRNTRFKMIPRVHHGPWIVKQSVGDVACLLGKSLVITYHRGQNYIELDVDIGSSMVASGILRIALSYVNSYIVDIAFLVEAELQVELPEELLGTLRIARAELSAAVPYPYGGP